MIKSENLIQHLQKARQLSLPIGLIGLVLCVVGLFVDRTRFFASYIPNVLFFLGISLGTLPLICIHHLTCGDWGLTVRRTFEAITKVIPFMFVFILPLLIFCCDIYMWTDAKVVAHAEILKHKAAYLNVPGFIFRAILYFVIWTVFAYFLRKGSLDYDKTPEKRIFTRMQQLSGVGLVVYALSVTFASIDWVMSLEPHWYSTIYGLIFVVGQALTCMTVVVLFITFFAGKGSLPFSKIITANRAHDLGNLLFAMTILWTYISLSQFVIIWSGNIQEEVTWYATRLNYSFWGYVMMILAICNFVIPFFLLVNRRNKLNIHALTKITALILCMRWLELQWLVKPAIDSSIHITVWDLASLFGVGGVWLWLVSGFLLKSPLAFPFDPTLEDAHQGGRH